MDLQNEAETNVGMQDLLMPMHLYFLGGQKSLKALSSVNPDSVVMIIAIVCLVLRIDYRYFL
jgi:hypothetical protein